MRSIIIIMTRGKGERKGGEEEKEEEEEGGRQRAMTRMMTMTTQVSSSRTGSEVGSVPSWRTNASAWELSRALGHLCLMLSLAPA